MRMRVGVVATAMVASALAYGVPSRAQETPTTVEDTTATTVEDTAAETTTATTAAGTTTNTTAAGTTTATTTADTVSEDATATTVDCPAPTTLPGSTTTVDETTTTTTAPDCAAPTTAPTSTATDPTSTATDPSTTVADAAGNGDLAAPAPTTTEPGGLGSVGPASGGQGPPVRGTQVQTRPIPPAPTTTTTTTTSPPPVWGLPANSGSGRRVVYSKSRQRVWAVDSNGVVIKTHLVSGRQTPLDPRPGHYRVWSRSRYTFSINNPSITWGFMVRFAWGAQGGNIGFHEIPFQYGQPVQSIWQLGQPLSGGCVRQARPDAIWMWNWAQLGTRVVVLG